MYPDESAYLWWTNLIFMNNWIPPEEILKFSPPLLNYLLAILTVLFGEEIDVLRMLSVVFGSLTVPFMYLLGKALYDRKVGLLSAFFLCFSSYHCLYSRIIYLDALTLFFAVAFSYFFWMGYFRSKKMWYIVMAGMMLGLAMLFHSIKRFEIPIAGIACGAIRNLQFWDIITRGIKDYLGILTYGYQNIPFYHLFRASALILIPITFLFHALHVIRAKHAESFIMALILSAGIIVVGCARHKYYLMYTSHKIL
jgi:dolichyl-phosphate-mannose--protein O-mannosyl transferase